MNYKKKIGLGRGLSALLDHEDISQNTSSNIPSETFSPGNISQIKLIYIKTNPAQPRLEFDEASLTELAESIRTQGLIQPITVRKLANHAYQLISGERRLRAARLAGLTEIPAYIRSIEDHQMLELALIENIQREDLNPIEVALSFQRMIDECRLKQDELGERVNKNRSTIANYLRLLKLAPPIQAAIRDKKLSMGHAKAILGLENAEQQLTLYNDILTKDLSVRKTEAFVRKLLGQKLKPAKASDKVTSFQYQKIKEDLASKFSTQVKLNVQATGKGSIEIIFSSKEDFGRILELLDW